MNETEPRNQPVNEEEIVVDPKTEVKVADSGERIPTLPELIEDAAKKTFPF